MLEDPREVRVSPGELRGLAQTVGSTAGRLSEVIHGTRLAAEWPSGTMFSDATWGLETREAYRRTPEAAHSVTVRLLEELREYQTSLRGTAALYEEADQSVAAQLAERRHVADRPASGAW